MRVRKEKNGNCKQGVSIRFDSFALINVYANKRKRT